MIQLHAREKWALGGGFTRGPGVYLVENIHAAQALRSSPGVSVRTVANPLPFNPTAAELYERILIVRAGGFGDILFTTPLVRALHAQFPHIEIHYACHPVYSDAIRNHPDVARVHDYPLTQFEQDEFDGVLWFENLIEFGGTAVETLPYQDIIADHAGVELTEGKHLDYHPDEDLGRLVLLAASEALGGRPLAAVQLEASSPCRCYPGPKLAQVMRMLVDDGYHVLGLGAPRDRGDTPEIEHMSFPCAWTPPAAFAESASLVSMCAGFIGPDSALLHVAGALGVPAVGLYGPFPWQIRTAHAEATSCLTGRCPMSPCFHHDRESLWPSGGPCEDTRQCEALASIDPNRIRALFHKQVRASREKKSGAALAVPGAGS